MEPDTTPDAATPEFESVYRQHVASTAAGDVESAIADIDTALLPEIMSGITAPLSGAESYEIHKIAVDGDRAIGECSYTTTDGVIGLRSTWSSASGTWKAIGLENFES